MRSLFLTLSLIAVLFAGCIDEADEGPQKTGGDDTPDAPEVPITKTHSDYGFVTADDLPVADENETLPEDNSTAIVWKKPAYRPLPSTLNGIDALGHVDGTNAGNGIAIFGPLAFVGNTGGPVKIVNIMDPENPEVLATAEAAGRDIDTILYPDGRLIMVSTGGGRQMTITDVTIPREPKLLSLLSTPSTNHNIAVVPGTPIVYNSPSSGSNTDIIDLSDPENPVITKTWNNGYGCHDISFYMNATEEKYRAYCAGLDVVQIWDLSNATNPEVITERGWPAAGVDGTGSASIATFAHLAIVNHDASVLILGDETGGGAAPGCDVYANAAGTTVSGPLGNLYFYDLTNELNPVLHGHVSPMATDSAGTCTAHFGEVIEDTNHVAMAFYSHGVLLVDFNDLDNPVIKDSYQNGNVWDVQYYQGYLFTGNISQGMEVLTLN